MPKLIPAGALLTHRPLGSPQSAVTAHFFPPHLMLLDLGPDILTVICRYFSLPDLYNFARVCKLARRAAFSRSFLELSNRGHLAHNGHWCELLFKRMPFISFLRLVGPSNCIFLHQLAENVEVLNSLVDLNAVTNSVVSAQSPYNYLIRDILNRWATTLRRLRLVGLGFMTADTLATCGPLTHLTLQHSLRALPPTLPPQLIALDISRNGLDLSMMPPSPTLRHLNVSMNGLTDGVVGMIPNLFPHLQSLVANQAIMRPLARRASGTLTDVGLLSLICEDSSRVHLRLHRLEFCNGCELSAGALAAFCRHHPLRSEDWRQG
ncbi:hypothetical protein PAPYR_6003 [Paratrimastix pyriformis]|uniref:F-box domain-containing protein n=1 Tax=Paratrimastix pyriformis TaxID=342808 RepID=A0ABQ8UHP3_9EUKA|nr:hypothetical protein PAPYR_6003 [Paratrimastix pyriformis]